MMGENKLLKMKKKNTLVEKQKSNFNCGGKKAALLLKIKGSSCFVESSFTTLSLF